MGNKINSEDSHTSMQLVILASSQETFGQGVDSFQRDERAVSRTQHGPQKLLLSCWLLILLCHWYVIVHEHIDISRVL